MLAALFVFDIKYGLGVRMKAVLNVSSKLNEQVDVQTGSGSPKRKRSKLSKK